MATNMRQRLIHNPLLERTIAELENDVRQFHDRVRLGSSVDVEVLVRGARAAQNPRAIGDIRGITQTEERALESEKKWGFREQTEELKVAILVTACSAVIQGWQQSTINAAALRWGCEFGFDIDYCRPDDVNQHRSKLLFGFINAAPPLVGSLVGTWLSDPVQEKVTGRLPALFLAALCSLVAAIGSYYARSWQMLLTFRVIMGVGMGAKASIAPILAAEVAVDHLRGSLTMSWQLFDALGIFLGFAVSVAALDEWRLVLASAMVPVVPLFILIYLCPESPRFLIRKNRYRDAYDSLRRFRKTEIQACRDLYAIHSQLQIEAEIVRRDPEGNSNWYSHEVYQDEVRDMHYWQRIYRLVTRRRNLRASVSSSICMAAQQLCGINVLAFYSSSVYGVATASEIISSHRKAAWLSFGFGLANFLFTIPAYGRIDSRGRRSLLLMSLAGMAISLIVVAPCFKIADDMARTAAVAILTIVVFTFFYSIGAGPVPFTLSAEVFPLAYREVGMSMSVMVNFLGLGLLVLFVPQLTEAFGGRASNCSTDPAGCQDASRTGQARLLGLFAGLNVLAFILVFLFVRVSFLLDTYYSHHSQVPSTADPTLEELNSIFNTKTKEHVTFQLSDNIPWLFKHLNPFSRSEMGPRFLTRAQDLEEQQWTELQTRYNMAQRVDAESGQQHQIPEQEFQHVEFTSGDACEGNQPQRHFQRTAHDGGVTKTKTLDRTQREVSITSEAVASTSEESSEAVPGDLKPRKPSTAETLQTSQKPSPWPIRKGVENPARRQSTQMQSEVQMHGDGEDLLREVLRRVRWIEDAIVGQRQGQGQGRYERLSGEESREDGEHGRGGKGDGEGNGDGDEIENDGNARSYSK